MHKEIYTVLTHEICVIFKVCITYFVSLFRNNEIMKGFLKKYLQLIFNYDNKFYE